MKYYGISAAAKSTGITESTLRRWKSNGFFTADRVFPGEFGMRLFSNPGESSLDSSFSATI